MKVKYVVEISDKSGIKTVEGIEEVDETQKDDIEAILKFRLYFGKLKNIPTKNISIRYEVIND